MMDYTFKTNLQLYEGTRGSKVCTHRHIMKSIGQSSVDMFKNPTWKKMYIIITSVRM